MVARRGDACLGRPRAGAMEWCLAPSSPRFRSERTAPRSRRPDFVGHVDGSLPCGEGFAYAAADPAIGLVDAGGLVKVLQGPRTADMRGKIGKGLEISGDAETVRFGLVYGEGKPVLFDVAAGSFADSPNPIAGLAPARVDGMPVTDWIDNEAPKFRGVKIALNDYEKARALAIRPDGSGFALGANWDVRAFDATGKSVWKQDVPGEAFGVDFSADGQLLVVACGDGTIRWLRGSDGVELLALFVDVPTRRWVAWTPTGYYMASPGGEDLIGWHINRGWVQEADFFPASRFSARFNRPDIVQLVLKTRDEATAVGQANEKAKRKRETAPIETTLPPVIKIASPTADGKFTGDSVEVAFSVRSPSGLPIDRVDALIDGRPVEARGVAPAAAQTGDQRRLTVPAPAHDFELGLVARSGALASEVARVRLVYAGAPAVEQVLKPKLYAVTIGVSDYVDPDLRLGYAADDARGFAAVLLRQKGGLYSDVQVKILADREVTRASVVEALDWLGKSVTARDVAMVLIAGHGVTDEKQNYWFLPADVSMKHLSSSAVSQDDILRAMRGVYGKAILFLDTCHANQAVAGARGPVDVNSVVNELAKTENGLIVFSSSQGRESSREVGAIRARRLHRSADRRGRPRQGGPAAQGRHHGLWPRRLDRRPRQATHRRPPAPRHEPPQHRAGFRLRGREVGRAACNRDDALPKPRGVLVPPWNCGARMETGLG